MTAGPRRTRARLWASLYAAVFDVESGEASGTHRSADDASESGGDEDRQSRQVPGDGDVPDGAGE